MAYILGILVFLTISAYSSYFYQGYLVPKAAMFCLLIIIATIYLATKKHVYLPKKEVLWFSALVLSMALVFGLNTIAPFSGILYASYGFGLFVLYILFLNFTPKEINILLLSIVITGFIQVFIGFAQFFELLILLPRHLEIQNSKIIGSIGNPEFLATLLGVCVFTLMHFYDQLKIKKHKIFVLSILTLFVICIFITKNKGTVVFLSLYAIWRITKSTKITMSVSVIGIILILSIFPTSINGRFSLWFSSLAMIKDNFFLGVGPRQFINHYLESVHNTFEYFPSFSENLGSYTAMVLDSHNIFLNSWAEFGVFGLILALVLIAYMLRLIKTDQGYLTIAALYIVYKSMYTVMLNSLTGALLFIIFIAIITPKHDLLKITIKNRLIVAAIPILIMMCFLTTRMSLADYYYQKGLTHLIISENNKAKASFTLANEYNREDSNYYLALANIHFQTRQLELMDMYINKTIHYQKSMDTYKISAHMYFYSGEYNKAFKIYRYIHSVFPEHLTTMGKMALIHQKRNEFHEAVYISNKLLNTQPRVKNDSDMRNYNTASMVLERSNNALMSLESQ